MATKREVMFWRKHRDDGSLLQMVRAHRDRAIKFFGAFAVFGENELQLLRLLEAHEMLATSDEDLLVKLNRVSENLRRSSCQPFGRRSEKCLASP